MSDPTDRPQLLVTRNVATAVIATGTILPPFGFIPLFQRVKTRGQQHWA